MIQLSYSQLRMVHEASHNWVNKQVGVKPEERDYWKAGKKAHRIIQDVVSGKRTHPNLDLVDGDFPIVEEEDFDPRCKFDFVLRERAEEMGKDYTAENEYNVIGFYDGLNPKEKKFLEIKTSSSPWSLGKFQRSNQRKLYALANPSLEEAVLITCRKDPELWEIETPKEYSVPIAERGYTEVLDWVFEGIEIIESGVYTGGLDEDGVCTNPYCYYGKNCLFKEVRG